VQNLAGALTIEWVFLPGCSPHLSRLERLWQLVKTSVLNSRASASFAVFRQTIDLCLDELTTRRQASTQTLMARHFQTFKDVA